MQKTIFNFLLFILSISIISCGSGKSSDNSSTEGLSKAIFEAFKAEDFSKMKELIPNAEVLKKAVEESEGRVKFKVEEIVEIEQEIEKSIKESFEDLLSKASSRFKMSEISFKSSKELENAEEEGLESAKVKFIFSTSKDDLGVEYEAAKVDGKWYVVESLKAVKGNSEE